MRAIVRNYETIIDSGRDRIASLEFILKQTNSMHLPQGRVLLVRYEDRDVVTLFTCGVKIVFPQYFSRATRTAQAG